MNISNTYLVVLFPRAKPNKEAEDAIGVTDCFQLGPGIFLIRGVDYEAFTSRLESLLLPSDSFFVCDIGNRAAAIVGGDLGVPSDLMAWLNRQSA